jgi:hypothetical protein
MAHVDAHFVRDNVRQCCLAESGRAENKNMIEGFATAPRRLNEDIHLLLDAWLADIFSQGLGPDGTIERPVLVTGFRTRKSVVFNACHVIAPPAAGPAE